MISKEEMRKTALLDLLKSWVNVRYEIDSNMEYACKSLNHPKRDFSDKCYCGEKEY